MKHIHKLGVLAAAGLSATLAVASAAPAEATNPRLIIYNNCSRSATVTIDIGLPSRLKLPVQAHNSASLSVRPYSAWSYSFGGKAIGSRLGGVGKTVTFCA